MSAELLPLVLFPRDQHRKTEFHRPAICLHGPLHVLRHYPASSVGVSVLAGTQCTRACAPRGWNATLANAIQMNHVCSCRMFDHARQHQVGLDTIIPPCPPCRIHSRMLPPQRIALCRPRKAWLAEKMKWNTVDFAECTKLTHLGAPMRGTFHLRNNGRDKRQ